MKQKNGIIFYIILIFDFYILPFFINDSGSAITLLLIIMPLVCLLDSVFYGIKFGFRIHFSLITALLFIPSIFIYYNGTAWSYILIFCAIAIVGNFIGKVIKRK